METYLKNIGNNTIRKNDYLLADSYKIDDFNPVDMNEISGGVCAIISQTGAGKTVLLKDLLEHTKENYEDIYLFSRTAKLQPCYDCFHRYMIRDDFDEEELNNIWDQQVKINERGDPMPKVLVILDDIIASPSYKKSKILEECSISARHLNITVILLSQNFTSIKPIIRNNIRIAISFQMQSKKEREKFSEAFLGADSSRAGDILLRRITDTKYQCLIVQVYKNGETLSNKVKKYIANPDINLVLPNKQKERLLKEKEMIRPVTTGKVLVKRVLVRGSKYGI